MTGQTRGGEVRLHFLSTTRDEINATELLGVSSDRPIHKCIERNEVMYVAFWLMVAVVGTAIMGFVSFAVWVGNREKEREAHFRNEMAQRIAETGDAGPVLEFVRETERTNAARTRLKARVAGLITTAIGVALMIFLYQLVPSTPVYLAGLIPLLVGVVLLIFSELMMKPDD
jgi:hypothetical protein